MKLINYIAVNGLIVGSVFAFGMIANQKANAQEKKIKPMSVQTTYASSAIDEIIKQADNDPVNGLLEQRELVALLRKFGYNGAPIPKYAVPYFTEGEELKVEMRYGQIGPHLYVQLPVKK